MIMKKCCSHEMRGLALATVAWIICCISMGLPQWRVWYFQNPVASKPIKVFVGMWRVCAIYNDDGSSNIEVCHLYNYRVPLDIRVTQQLLLISSFLGLVGKITTIICLWNICVGGVPKNATYNPFVLHGILNIIASTFVCLNVLINYVFILFQKEIEFPSSFNIPFQPDTQEIGSAMVLAIIAAILFLLSGTILLSSSIPKEKPTRSKV